jgi:hypothetical protein
MARQIRPDARWGEFLTYLELEVAGPKDCLGHPRRCGGNVRCRTNRKELAPLRRRLRRASREDEMNEHAFNRRADGDAERKPSKEKSPGKSGLVKEFAAQPDGTIAAIAGDARNR